MPAYKSHHYVPQMYMRLFSDDGLRVGVYVIRTGRFIPQAPISGQACRDYFYGKDPRTEQAFGRMEDGTATVLARAAEHRALPDPGSEDHERLIFFLGIQHCRTMAAAQQHEEGSVKALKSMLRRQAELEGNAEMLDALERVQIRRKNGVSELVGYATVAANLLTDLTYVLLVNKPATQFVASDAPVVLHNRLYENQRIAVTGYANVGLQLFLPLGPGVALFGYDPAVYEVAADGDRTVRLELAEDVRLINDLQWEAANAVLLTSPGTDQDQLEARLAHWTANRRSERVVFREEVVEETGSQVRTRQGGGSAPSTIALDLSFVSTTSPSPASLGKWDIPPFRDPERVARTDAVFARIDEEDETRRRAG